MRPTMIPVDQVSDDLRRFVQHVGRLAGYEIRTIICQPEFAARARCWCADAPGRRGRPMGRLTALKPALKTLPPPVRFAADRDEHGHSRQAEPWRRWYSLARWRRLRLTVFLRDLFTCQMPGCGHIEGDTSLLVADHVRPHRGDARLFWDGGNLQTLCKPCHDSLKQAAERQPQAV